MQRKPRKDKVLLIVAATTKMTDMLNILAKCEGSEQPTPSFMFSPSPFVSCADLQLELKDGASFIYTIPFDLASRFMETAAALEPKHVIIQYYT